MGLHDCDLPDKRQITLSGDTLIERTEPGLYVTADRLLIRSPRFHRTIEDASTQSGSAWRAFDHWLVVPRHDRRPEMSRLNIQ
jgi:hypothetical protein